jgi:HEPN domain-containing protein
MTSTQPIETPRSNEHVAIRFIHDAETFANAAKSLSDFRTFGPRYYLFCHAIELALKSYILASGGDLSELRNLGHNLVKALKRAKQLGFTPADKDLKLFVDWLNPYHHNHEFRYPKLGFKRVPRAEDLIPVIEGTLKQIEAVARNAFMKANPPSSQPSS